MLIPFFHEEERWQAFSKEVQSWEGTPYRHQTMIKGRGADCTMFIGAVWLSMGILTEVKSDYYAKDWHLHNKEEFVLDQFHEHWNKFAGEGLKIIKVNSREIDTFYRGDVLCFSCTPTGITNHATIWFGYFEKTKEKNQMYNSINGHGVCRLTYGSFWQKRLTTIFRVVLEA